MFGLAVLVVSGASCHGSSQVPPGAQGIIEYQDRIVSFEVPGRVARVAVLRGDEVTPGTVLAELDDTLERLTRATRADDANAARAELALLEAGSRKEDIAAAAAQVEAAKASEEVLRKAEVRVKSLHETASVSEAELDQAQGELDRARAERATLEQKLVALRRGPRVEEIARARALVESSASAVALEDERLVRYTLRAKEPGQVLDILVEPGELAAVGTPAVMLADTRHPYCEVFVRQGELGGIQRGTRAVVTVDGSPHAFGGWVEHIAPQTEFTPKFLFSEKERPNLVIRVRVRIDDSRGELHAGVPAFVRFEGASAARVSRK